MVRFRTLAALLGGMLILGGCAEDDGRVTVYPVTGKVLSNGQPVDGARIVFYPVSEDLKGMGMPVPAGTTDENGEFQLQSYEPDDGAPAGEFNVTVIWPEPIPPNVDQEMYQPQDRLQGRYSKADQSGLTVTVEKGGGELPPLELE